MCSRQQIIRWIEVTATGLISSAVVLFWQEERHFDNLLTALTNDIKTTQDTLIDFSQQKSIPFVDWSIPDKYWSTLSADDLRKIGKCDRDNQLDSFYKQLGVLKKDYALYMSLISTDQRPTPMFDSAIDIQELKVLKLVSPTLESIQSCATRFPWHRFKNN